MVATFDAAKFTIAPPTILVVESINAFPEWDALAARFGTTWRRIPGGRHANVRWIRDSTKDVQLTLLLHRDGTPREIAVYTETFDDFKNGFGKVTFDAVYHQIKPNVAMAAQIIEALKYSELW